MIQTVICEDNASFLKYSANRIGEILGQFGEEYCIDPFDKSTDLLEKIQAGSVYDIAFLDIDMPGIDGIALGTVLRRKLPALYIIYLSGREDLVFDSFKTRPYSFIPKSRLDEMLLPTMTSLLASMHDPGNFISFATGNLQYRWNLTQLVYIECINRTLYIHFIDHTDEIHYTLEAMEKLLSPHGFLRIHKGYLVNYRYIFSIGRTEILLDSRETLPLSKRRAAQVIEAFSRLV